MHFKHSFFFFYQNEVCREGRNFYMNFKKELLYYLHDLSSQLLTLSQSLGQHGLCELNEKSYQTAHAIPCVSRGRYKRNKSAGILILIKQGRVQALESGLTVT